MPEERVFQFDVGAEVDRYFDDSSLSSGAEPRIVILMGGPAVGKTTIRKQRFATGYVLVDAAEVFLSLSRGDYFDFPGPFGELLDVIGPLVARRAITERRHIVTELIGSQFELTKDLIEAMRAIGYRAEMQAIICDIEEAQRRNLSRGNDNISAYYAELYQRRWLTEAATKLSETIEHPMTNQDHKPLFPTNPPPEGPKITKEEQYQRALVLEEMLKLEDEGKRDSAEWRMLLERLDQIAHRN